GEAGIGGGGVEKTTPLLSRGRASPAHPRFRQAKKRRGCPGIGERKRRRSSNTGHDDAQCQPHSSRIQPRTASIRSVITIPFLPGLHNLRQKVESPLRPL